MTPVRLRCRCCLQVAQLIASEYFDQGDIEKMQLNMQPTNMMDRNNSSQLPRMQINFIDSVCTPVYQVCQTAYSYVCHHSKSTTLHGGSGLVASTSDLRKRQSQDRTRYTNSNFCFFCENHCDYYTALDTGYTPSLSLQCLLGQLSLSPTVRGTIKWVSALWVIIRNKWQSFYGNVSADSKGQVCSLTYELDVTGTGVTANYYTPNWSYPRGKNRPAPNYPQGIHRLAKIYSAKPVFTLIICSKLYSLCQIFFRLNFDLEPCANCFYFVVKFNSLRRSICRHIGHRKVYKILKLFS